MLRRQIQFYDGIDIEKNAKTYNTAAEDKIKRHAAWVDKANLEDVNWNSEDGYHIIAGINYLIWKYDNAITLHYDPFKMDVFYYFHKLKKMVLENLRQINQIFTESENIDWYEAYVAIKDQCQPKLHLIAKQQPKLQQIAQLDVKYDLI